MEETVRKPYLTIRGGMFRQKVGECTEGAKKFEYETSSGEKGVKYELEHKEITGKIMSVSFKDGDYGKTLELEFPDYIVSVNTATRYFGDLAGRLCSSSIDLPVTLHPYEIELDELNPKTKKPKVRVGVSVVQNGQKLKTIFFDGANGAPKKEQDEDWQEFFTRFKKFHIKEITNRFINKSVTVSDLDKLFGSSEDCSCKPEYTR
jgi:hypothetical protein